MSVPSLSLRDSFCGAAATAILAQGGSTSLFTHSRTPCESKFRSMAVAAAPQNESLRLSDGTLMGLTRVQGVDDATWIETKAYLEDNPDVAKSLQKFARDPVTMRNWLQTRALAENYHTKMNSGDPQVQYRLQALEHDPELAPILADIKKNGMEVMMKYYQNEELMFKISQKMGGLPGELQ